MMVDTDEVACRKLHEELYRKFLWWDRRFRSLCNNRRHTDEHQAKINHALARLDEVHTQFDEISQHIALRWPDADGVDLPTVMR
jgi:hypothetical protein